MNPTEIAEQSESGEYISEHAQHWCVESFIPVPSCDLREFLAEKLTSPGQRQWFLEACDRIARWTREQSLRLHEKFDTAYAALDPDRDTSLILTRSLEHYEQSATDVDQLMRQAVAAANYVEISREELEQACLISSLWGVPLHVDLKIFRHLAVFARGDRELSKALYFAWKNGCRFDSWKENFDLGRWIPAFRECGIDPDRYSLRERGLDESLPWGFIVLR